MQCNLTDLNCTTKNALFSKSSIKTQATFGRVCAEKMRREQMGKHLHRRWQAISFFSIGMLINDLSKEEMLYKSPKGRIIARSDVSAKLCRNLNAQVLQNPVQINSLF